VKHRYIGFGPIKRFQIPRRSPGYGRMLMKRDLSRLDDAYKRIKGDDELRIMMRRGGEIPLDTNANTELLNELASKTFLRRFTRIDFAAGKFPFERHISPSAPLGGKNESITFDDGAGNMDMLQMNSPDKKRTRLFFAVVAAL
jgi:hypothetical protein